MVEVALRTRTLGSPDSASLDDSDDASRNGDELRGGRKPPQPPSTAGRVLRLGWAALETAAIVAGLGWAAANLRAAHDAGQSAQTVISGVRIDDVDVEGLGRDDLNAVAQARGIAASAQPLAMVAGPVSTGATASELGASPWIDGAVDGALQVGRSGDAIADLQTRIRADQGEFDFRIGYTFDEARALSRLLVLAPRVETPSLPTQLDFDTRKVVPATRGTALLAYDSLSAVAIGLARGAETIELVVQDKPPVDDRLKDVADALDISVVLGSFETPYQTNATAADRTHNLKVGATAIDGTVLLPGEVFSFNEVVGERSAEAGYRYGTGISAGQLVDVLGGGICQVSSTIYGAAFFSGVELVRSRPHSRPSSYVDMGLDSTVVWPSVDMKFRNDYDFPVVLHMTVSSGKVRAEVLGPRRPYQVAFERELDEMLAFKTVIRDDSRLLAGHTRLAQRGRRGFKVKRFRQFIQGGDVVKDETWELTYPPTTEIVRRGTSASGKPAEKKTLPALRDPAPHLKIVQ